MQDRPAPSPSKLTSQFGDWVSGTELPGRTMAYLKTGFLDQLLEEGEDSEGLSAMREAWAGWESGDIGPEDVLTTLQERGLEEFLAGITG